MEADLSIIDFSFTQMRSLYVKEVVKHKNMMEIDRELPFLEYLDSSSESSIKESWASYPGASKSR